MLLRQQSLIEDAAVEAVIVPGVRWQRARVAAAVGARLTVLHLAPGHHLVVAMAHLLVALHVVDAIRAQLLVGVVRRQRHHALRPGGDNAALLNARVLPTSEVLLLAHQSVQALHFLGRQVRVCEAALARVLLPWRDIFELNMVLVKVLDDANIIVLDTITLALSGHGVIRHLRAVEAARVGLNHVVEHLIIQILGVTHLGIILLAHIDTVV